MTNPTRILLVTIFTIMNACGGNTRVGTSTDPNISAPDNDVAVNVGPVEQTVTADVLDKANDIRDSIMDVIEGEEAEIGTGFLRYVRPEDQPIETEIDLGEEEGCDEGGTKTIIGSVTLTTDSSQSSGTVIGSYTLQYQTCQQIVLLTGSGGTCSAHATIDGEVSVTLNTTFTISQRQESKTLSDTTDVGASTTTALDIAVGATASNQTYSFTYNLSSSSSGSNLEGTVAYNNLLYDLLEVESFVEGAVTAVLCP